VQQHEGFLLHEVKPNEYDALAIFHMAKVLVYRSMENLLGLGIRFNTGIYFEMCGKHYKLSFNSIPVV
jgi:hypothetical protein